MDAELQVITISIRDRNQLRQHFLLPLLDEEYEIACAAAILERNERQNAIDAYKDVYLKLRDDVLTDLRAERGDDFPQNSFSHRILVVKAEQRFRKYLASIGMENLPTPSIPSM